MTPKRESGTVEMVSVAWIMQNVVSSVDGFTIRDENNQSMLNLSRMIREKGADYPFDRLLNTIVKRGFRVPICLYTDGGEHFHLGNGHHRLVAAILLVLNEIPVFWSDDDYMQEEHTETEECDIVADEFEGIQDDIRALVW